MNWRRWPWKSNLDAVRASRATSILVKLYIAEIPHPTSDHGSGGGEGGHSNV